MRSWDDYKKTMVIPDSLTQAAKANDVALLGQLLAKGHDLNARDHRGYSPLMLAAYTGAPEALQFLIERGADLNLPDFAGNTPLMGVGFKGNRRIAEMLIEAGADIHARNAAGMDAYDVALTFGRTELAKLFTEQGIKERKVQKIRFFWKLCVQHFSQKLAKRRAV